MQPYISIIRLFFFSLNGTQRSSDKHLKYTIPHGFLTRTSVNVESDQSSLTKLNDFIFVNLYI